MSDKNKEDKDSYCKSLLSMRDQIIIGEIGALLHDIGKMDFRFIKKNAEGYTGLKFYHTDIDEFLIKDLLYLIKKHISNDSSIIGIYELIKYHHDPKSYNHNPLVVLLKYCDRKASATDKGLLVKKQPLDDTNIISPFGFEKTKINRKELQGQFDYLQNILINSFHLLKKTKLILDFSNNKKKNCSNNNNENIELLRFRNEIIKNLKIGFGKTLGETRILGNDVLLWDHSYSTASLFKSVLSAITCIKINLPDYFKDASFETKEKDYKFWRLFGIRWNGMKFINQGIKIGDFIGRAQHLQDFKNEIINLLEWDYPIGNMIYEDINGIFFTFPNLELEKEFNKTDNNQNKSYNNENNNIDKSFSLANELIQIIIEKIDNMDLIKNDLNFFFTLSEPTDKTKIIPQEIQNANKILNLPQTSHIILVYEGLEYFLKFRSISSQENNYYSNNRDVCPICKKRPISSAQNHKYKNRCKLCGNVYQKRLKDWLEKNSLKETIWFDEVADINNRIALISVDFPLEKWLDGIILSTILSNFNKSEISDADIKDAKKALKNLKENNKNENNKVIIQNYLLKEFKSDKKICKIIRASIDKLNNPKELYRFFYEMIFIHPSPARLYRIWNEIKEFINEYIKKPIRKLFDQMNYNRKRLEFYLASNNNLINEEGTYILKLNGIEPIELIVYITKDQKSSNNYLYKVITIENLQRFSTPNNKGINAVKEALKNGIIAIKREGEPWDNTQQIQSIVIPNNNDFRENSYLPVVFLNDTPTLIKMLVPATRAMEIINIIYSNYKKVFNYVQGKLFMNIKLLVVGRKYPLYALVDSEKRMLDLPLFIEQKMMDPWWDIDKNSKNYDYYRYYPIVKISNINEHKDYNFYNLDNLRARSRAHLFALFPGYFDFELISDINSQFKIFYSENGKRKIKEYKLFSNRPYYLYQIEDINRLWSYLSENLTESQIRQLEESLIFRINSFKNINNLRNNIIFKNFVVTLLSHTFDQKWDQFRTETQNFIINSAINGMLLDTIYIYKKMIKMEVKK